MLLSRSGAARRLLGTAEGNKDTSATFCTSHFSFQNKLLIVHSLWCLAFVNGNLNAVNHALHKLCGVHGALVLAAIAHILTKNDYDFLRSPEGYLKVVRRAGYDDIIRDQNRAFLKQSRVFYK